MTVLVRNKTVSTVDTRTVIFTANSKTRITAFTAANNVTSNVDYKAYIGGVIIPLKTVVRDRFDSGSSLINHTMNTGETLEVENSQANGLVFNMSGEINV